MYINTSADINDTIVVSTKTTPSIANHVLESKGLPEMVIIQEDDDMMFADINKIIEANNMYFIVDTYGSHTVVSYDSEGKPIASYGRRGNGPGEYTFPWDVDVNNEGVYILDVSASKLLKYTHDGNYIATTEVPFNAQAFKILNDNKILFNLAPNAVEDYQLCVTDSDLNPLIYMLHYPKDYVGGYVTNNVFRKQNDIISYYLSPTDTIYQLDNDANIINKRLITFEDKSLPEEAKLNYMDAFEKGLVSSGNQLKDNPIVLPSGKCIMKVSDYSKKEVWIVTYDLVNKENFAEKLPDQMSVYDVIMPCALSQDNKRIISYLDGGIVEKCKDYEILPDSIKQALDEGYRILVLHNVEEL